MLVIKRKRLVVVVNRWQVWIGQHICQNLQASTLARLQLTGFVAYPATLPFFLVLPFFGIANAGLGFNVIEPSVLNPIPAGPNVFASDGACVTADTLVQI